MEDLKNSIRLIHTERVVYEKGDQARFRKISTETMMKLQKDADVKWVPLLEDVSQLQS